jgi:predicted amidophosphoribosyltransferase
MKKEKTTAAKQHKTEKETSNNPLRWIDTSNKNFELMTCPKCMGEYEYYEYNYCPNCGQRLLPPKKKK